MQVPTEQTLKWWKHLVIRERATKTIAEATPHAMEETEPCWASLYHFWPLCGPVRREEVASGGLNAPGSLPHINSHGAGSQLVHRLAGSRTLAQKSLLAFVSTSFQVFSAAFMRKAFQDKNLPVFLQRLQPCFLIYSLKCPLNSMVMAGGKQKKEKWAMK